jgi:RimK family alpha-L-glutamate ligase
MEKPNSELKEHETEEHVDINAGYESGEESVNQEEPQYVTIKVPKSEMKYNLKPKVINNSSITFYNAQDIAYYRRKLKNPSLTVWILSASAENILYANRRIIETGWRMNVQVNVMEVSKFEIIVSNERSNLILYNCEEISEPDVVIPRLGAKIDYFGLAVIRHLEKTNSVLVLNKSEGIEISKDKLSTIQQLGAHGIPVPKTMFAKFPLDIECVDKHFGFPLILKKSSGSQGKGVMLINSKDTLSDVADMVDPNKPLIVQEFIKKSEGKDIRVFVVGGKAIGGMLRVAKKGFKANFHQGGYVKPVALKPEIEWLACETAKLCGLDVAGVDILIDTDSYKICEINSSPGFQGFELATSIDIAKSLISFCQIRSGVWKKAKSDKPAKKIVTVPVEAELLGTPDVQSPTNSNSNGNGNGETNTESNSGKSSPSETTSTN